jgi:hypothetical protein
MPPPDTFEEAFAAVEQQAADALTSAAQLVKHLKQLQKAAREGRVTTLKRTGEELPARLAEVSAAVELAAGSWPLGDEEETRYLSDDFAAELRLLASERDLTIRDHDGQLIAHPSVVRILAGERAVRIDKKKVTTIRPSHLVEVLRKEQARPARFRPERFLEALHEVYQVLARAEASPAAGPVIQLNGVYRLLTSLPGSNRDYSRTDFARDLYRIDTTADDGVRTTKKGHRISFHASAGARSSRNLFTFVGPDGTEVKYYAIRFSENPG